MITFPNAKINLGLNVVEKRTDGYHNLETIFYPIPLDDALEIHLPKESLNHTTLYQSGMQVSGSQEDNLVMKAFRMLQEKYNLPHLNIYLNKHIPSGAGLGGGSSDAAFMLKLLNKRFDLHLSTAQLEHDAALLGADCAFFIQNKPTYAEGIGNVFSPVDLSLKGYQIVLVKPNIFVSTREAFALIQPHHPNQSLKEIVELPIEEWRNLMYNDFEVSVFKQFPEIGKIKDQLYEMGAIYASMSGSGSSLYGLFAPDVEVPTTSFAKDTFIYQGCL